MYTTVLNNQKIFDEPIIDEEGNIRINPNIEYNFDMVKETYDFAKENGKQVKFHTFLWHNAVPENLRNEIDAVQDPILKRKMALAFLQNYASSLANFMKENGYDLRQLEALNEIASDEPGENTLRDSWWKDVIGNKQENGDAYFIDVLKIVKRNFPDTEIIYNEYNEFISDKTDSYEQYREAFYLGRRQEQDYTITPNQIGKKSSRAHIGKKDIAKDVVDRKVEERTNPQELYPHNHNGSQGATNDGR